MSDEPGPFGLIASTLITVVVFGFVELLTPLLDVMAVLLDSMFHLAFEPMFVLVEAVGTVWFPAMLVAVIMGVAMFSEFLDELDTEAEPERSETEQTIEDAVAEVSQRYVAGDIDELEMEKQIARALDPDFHEIRDRVEEIGGIGDDLSKSIAIRFDSVDDIRAADPEDLRRVSGVGEQRAEAIRKRV